MRKAKVMPPEGRTAGIWKVSDIKPAITLVDFNSNFHGEGPVVLDSNGQTWYGDGYHNHEQFQDAILAQGGEQEIGRAEIQRGNLVSWPFVDEAHIQTMFQALQGRGLGPDSKIVMQGTSLPFNTAGLWEQPSQFQIPHSVEQAFVRAMECPMCHSNLLMNQPPPKDASKVYCPVCGWTPRKEKTASDLDYDEEYRKYKEEFPPVPAEEYKLDTYPEYDYTTNQPKPGVSRSYIHAPSSAWSFSFQNGDYSTLHLTLGDMGYHAIPYDFLKKKGPDETAKTFDETGAYDDIREICRAALMLLPGHPQVDMAQQEQKRDPNAPPLFEITPNYRDTNWKLSIPIKPEKEVEAPDWEPSEEPLTIPEETPATPAETPELVPVGELKMIPCPRNIPIKPEKEIEAPDWEPTEPTTIPEEWPEKAPTETPAPKREPVPAKVADDESLDLAYDPEPYGYKVLRVGRDANGDAALVSPSQRTYWPVGRPLVAEGDIEEFRRGGKGIHLVPEGDWNELYDYVAADTVLVKCRIYGTFWEGSTGSGKGILAQKAMPVLAVGTDKNILLQIANKYGIDTELAQTRDEPVQGPEGWPPTEYAEPTEIEQHYSEDHPGWTLSLDPGMHWKGFQFNKQKSPSRSADAGDTFAVRDETGRTRGTITIDFYSQQAEVKDVTPITPNDWQFNSFLSSYCNKLEEEGYLPIWDRNAEGAEDWDNMQYEVADWRDYEQINDVDDLLKVAQDIDGFSYDNWQYEWDSDDLKWEISDNTDEYGIHYWDVTVVEPAPPDLRFAPDDWNEVFKEEYENISNGENPENEITKAMIAVPKFIMEEHAQDGTHSNNAWKEVGMGYIEQTAKKALDDLKYYHDELPPGNQWLPQVRNREALEQWLTDLWKMAGGTTIQPEQQRLVTPQDIAPDQTQWVPWHNQEQTQIPGTFSKWEEGRPGKIAGTTLYHVSPSEFRDSIQEHGLDPSKGHGRVYFFQTPEQAGDFHRSYRGTVGDIWRVNFPSDTQLKVDPRFYSLMEDTDTIADPIGDQEINKWYPGEAMVPYPRPLYSELPVTPDQIDYYGQIYANDPMIHRGKIAAEFDAPLENPVSYQFVPWTNQEINAYYQETRDTRNIWKRRARNFTKGARRRGYRGTVTGRDLYLLNNRYQGNCAYCGQPGATSWDHVIPLGEGGEHTPSNILPAHLECNKELNDWSTRNRDYQDPAYPGQMSPDWLQVPATDPLEAPQSASKPLATEAWTLTSMAERTGDAELDTLIDQFMQEEYEYLCGGERDPENRMDYRKPEDATGECYEVSEYFANWLSQHGVQANLPEDEPVMQDMPWTQERRDPHPWDYGYEDRKISPYVNHDEYDPEEQHHVVIVRRPSGTYMIDFTAAQYGYSEFPMVQRFDPSREHDQWQRQWTSAAGNISFQDDPITDGSDGDERLQILVDGQPVGYVNFEQLWKDEDEDGEMPVIYPTPQGEPIFLNAMEVDEEHQRKGYATALINELLRLKGLTKDQLSGEFNDVNWPEGGAFWKSYFGPKMFKDMVAKLAWKRIEPHQELRDLAQTYMTAQRMPYYPPSDYPDVDEDRARRIADEYEQMEHAPNHPDVKAAYQALKNETAAQYQHLVNHGYQFEFEPPEGSYASPWDAMADIRNNRHMYVYPTSAGFGHEEASGHPLLEDSGYQWNGQPVTYNDLFRGVHDVFGHAKEGVGFRHHGEENAWRQHAAMFSDQARQALTSETRGQNSWVNFGPYGEQNQTADQGNTIYAPQKAGLLPEWTAYEGSYPGM